MVDIVITGVESDMWYWQIEPVSRVSEYGVIEGLKVYKRRAGALKAAERWANAHNFKVRRIRELPG